MTPDPSNHKTWPIGTKVIVYADLALPERLECQYIGNEDETGDMVDVTITHGPREGQQDYFKQCHCLPLFTRSDISAYKNSVKKIERDEYETLRSNPDMLFA